jgi:urocanate hydratase
VTDQTSARDPVNGNLPAGWTTEEWAKETLSPCRSRRPIPRHTNSDKARIAALSIKRSGPKSRSVLFG